MKKISVFTATLFMGVLMAASAFAGDTWQLKIKATSGMADNIIIVGQNPEALDTLDPVYDIPAMLSGDIEASIGLNGDQYWQSIMQSCTAACSKQWDITVASYAGDKKTMLSWDRTVVPSGVNMNLVDLSSGGLVDMLAKGSYQFDNGETRQFRVEAHVE